MHRPTDRSRRLRRCPAGSNPCQQGFALVVALALMGFLLLLLVGLAALTEVENRRQQGELDLLAARANALFGLRMALADLQRAAGPDARVTARADILTTDAAELAPGARFWTGVWDTNSVPSEDDEDEEVFPEPVWLVSGLGERTPLAGFGPQVEQVELVGQGTSAESVSAGLVRLAAEPGGSADRRYAWWIGDEGIKAKVNVISEAPDADDDQNLSLLLTARRFGIENVSELGSFASLIRGEDANPMLLGRVANYRQFQLLDENVASHALDRYFDLTTDSFGVLANTRGSGGLRRDLTAKLASDADLSDPMWEREFEGRPAIGPSWDLVREFARLVDSTTNPLYSGDGFPILPIQMSRVMGIPSYKSQQIYPTRPGLSPLLVFGGITYGISAEEIPTGLIDLRSFRLRLAMKPVVALWNPYDVAIESEEGYVLYFNSRNGGMHQFGPRFNIQNTSTDTYTIDRRDNVVFRTRNIPVASLMPGAPVPDRPQRTVWYDDMDGLGLRHYNPRFTIETLTLLPGEVAWFSLPSGTSGPYQFTDPGPFDSLYGANPNDAMGGPTLVRGHNPGAYVWAYIHDGPIGSTGYSDWEGTFADLGRVDFWVEEVDDEGNKIPFVTQVKLESLESSEYDYDDEGKIIGDPNELPPEAPPSQPEGETYGFYPVVLRLSQSSGGQFGAEFLKGRMVLWGSTNATRVLSYRNKLLQYFWSPHQATTPLLEEFFTANDFADTFVGRPPVHFSSWGIVLSTPGWDNPRQLLAHFNPRATVHHNFRSHNFGLGITTHGPIYHTEHDGGMGVPALFDISRIFPDDALRTIIYEADGRTEERTIGPILYHVPRNELVSIGQLSHLELARNCWAPSYVVGNSFASPWIPGDAIYFTAYEQPDSGFRFPFPDQSYLTNEVLWDDFFFSTFNEERAAPLNPRIKILNPSARIATADDPELFAASNMLIDGPFNVNSTSVEAWKAVLSSLNQASLPFGETGSDGSAWTDFQLDSPFPRSSHLSVFGALRSNGDLEFESWRSIPELTPDQIDTIAKRIVYELRLRGRPFDSLAQFINREPERTNISEFSSRNPRLMGILQRVLDADYGGTDRMDGDMLDAAVINPRGSQSDRISSSDVPDLAHFPTAFVGLRSTAVPGYLMQSDILQVLGPVLSARSDTFVIRAYGDTLNVSVGGADGEPLARAWCEAVVQRLPDYVDPTLQPGDDAESSILGSVFGRQFRLVSFRWLSPDEI